MKTAKKRSPGTKIGRRTVHASREWTGGRLFRSPPLPGKRVHHAIFGAGTVGLPDPKKPRGVYLPINFDVHGRKELIWAFAKHRTRTLVLAPKVSP
jgi:hypothetical protein